MGWLCPARPGRDRYVLKPHRRAGRSQHEERTECGQPKVGLRTSQPDEAWHIDTTVVRLLDGTKAYIHAVDNVSGRILAFRVSGSVAIEDTIVVRVEAAAVARATSQGRPFIALRAGQSA